MQRVILRSSRGALPTAAKLVAGIGLALTGFFTASAILPYLPAGTRGQGAGLMSMSFGWLIGWRVIGRAPQATMAGAARVGLRAALWLALTVLLYLGALQMMARMLRGRYHAVTEALTDILGQGVVLGGAAFQLDVIVTLFLGGVLSAILSAWAARRWQ